MAAKAMAAPGSPITKCEKPFYDAWSVYSVQCVTDKNEVIYMQVFDDADAEAKYDQRFGNGTKKIWLGNLWSVSAGNRQATLDAVVSALK